MSIVEGRLILNCGQPFFHIAEFTCRDDVLLTTADYCGKFPLLFLIRFSVRLDCELGHMSIWQVKERIAYCFLG